MSLIASAPRAIPPASSIGASHRFPLAIELGTWLGSALDAADIRYCQWTGQCHRDHWLTGEGDLDLLVDRADLGAFASTVARGGFKLTVGSARPAVGEMTFLAQPADLGRLIQLHVHTRLTIGRPSIGAFHLPIEAAVLHSSGPGRILRESSPGFALLVFVLRMTLRHDVRDQLVRGEPEWLVARQEELALLAARVPPNTVGTLLARHLPEVSPALFDRCARSLRLGTPRRERWVVRRQLERRLAGHRCPPVRGVMARTAAAVGRRLGIGQTNRAGRYLATGGAMIALIGADGAGKSTVARALAAGFQSRLSTVHAHLGRPPRSAFTLVAGAALKAGRWLESRLPNGRVRLLARMLELIRSLGTARDRYRLVRLLRARTAEGWVVIGERFPLRSCYCLAGPTEAYDRELAQSPIARWVRRRELDCYAALGTPDRIVILAVDPETAVTRKRDEPEDYVRRRADLFRAADWSGQDVMVIDAGQPIGTVLATVRDRVWSTL